MLKSARLAPLWTNHRLYVPQRRSSRSRRAVMTNRCAQAWTGPTRTWVTIS